MNETFTIEGSIQITRGGKCLLSSKSQTDAINVTFDASQQWSWEMLVNIIAKQSETDHFTPERIY